MDKRRIPWKAEWKAAGLDPGPLSAEEEALVPRLEAENKAFLERHPPRSLRLRPRRPLVAWAVPLAAAAVLALAVLPSAPAPGTTAERIKGPAEATLTVYRQGTGQAQRLAPGTAVKAGDVLQAAYRVRSAVQGALVSLDGGGNVTVHLAAGGRSVALVPGGERPLEFGYELDKAPRFEVFFLLTSPRPFDVEPVRQRLKNSAWESLPADAFGPDIGFVVLPLVKGAQP